MSFKPFLLDRDYFKVIVDMPWRMSSESKVGTFLTDDVDKMVKIYDEGELVIEIDCISGEIILSDVFKEKIK